MLNISFVFILVRLGLPTEIQTLGTTYARDEFKRHKNCQPDEAKIFLAEWTNYALSLSKQLIVRGKNKKEVKIGDNLNVDDLNKFKEDQIVQLYELSQAATGQADAEEAKVPQDKPKNGKPQSWPTATE